MGPAADPGCCPEGPPAIRPAVRVTHLKGIGVPMPGEPNGWRQVAGRALNGRPLLSLGRRSSSARHPRHFAEDVKGVDDFANPRFKRGVGTMKRACSKGCRCRAPYRKKWKASL